MIKKIFKLLLFFVILATIALAAVGIHGYHQYQQYEKQAPLTQLVAQAKASPNFVDYDNLPKTLIRATIAIEDHRFFSHSGIDLIGLLRAILSQVSDNFLRSGGSTISQQLVKNLYQQFNGGLNWKSAEFFFANALEKQENKQTIFALYVSQINYGNGYIGIKAASYGYFGVSPDQLSDAQCTILAGIPQQPVRYALTSPENIQAAKEKQALVLDAMVNYGYLKQEEADQIAQMDLGLN